MLGVRLGQGKSILWYKPREGFVGPQSEKTDPSPLRKGRGRFMFGVRFPRATLSDSLCPESEQHKRCPTCRAAIIGSSLRDFRSVVKLSIGEGNGSKAGLLKHKEI